MKTNQDYRILIVDDIEDNRDLLSRFLLRQNYQVGLANNGPQALELLQAAPYDAVLLDYMMPGMNGYEVLQQMKRPGSELAHIPVIMISAMDEIESVVKCIELGAEDYLPKPFNRVLLKARLSAVLEKKRLRDEEQEYYKALKRELEIGRQIQANFLPDKLPQVAGWELDARFHPAREVAGDFYDAFTLPNRRLALVIADVCDKGVPAALFMSLTRSLLRVLAQQARDSLKPENSSSQTGLVQVPTNLPGQATLELPADIAQTLNAVKLTNDYIAVNHSSTNMFATLFFGVLETDTGRLSYINAGHNAPILLGPVGVKSRLTYTGPAVGVMEGARYRVGQIELEPGDLLLTYTDGVPDARDATGQLFTEGALKNLLEQWRAEEISSVTDLLDRIEAQLKAHVGQAEPFDDITMLGINRLANS